MESCQETGSQPVCNSEDKSQGSVVTDSTTNTGTLNPNEFVSQLFKSIAGSECHSLDQTPAAAPRSAQVCTKPELQPATPPNAQVAPNPQQPAKTDSLLPAVSSLVVAPPLQQPSSHFTAKTGEGNEAAAEKDSIAPNSDWCLPSLTDLLVGPPLPEGVPPLVDKEPSPIKTKSPVAVAEHTPVEGISSLSVSAPLSLTALLPSVSTQPAMSTSIVVPSEQQVTPQIASVRVTQPSSGTAQEPGLLQSSPSACSPSPALSHLILPPQGQPATGDFPGTSQPSQAGVQASVNESAGSTATASCTPVQANTPSTQPAGSLVQANMPSTQPAGSLEQANTSSTQPAGSLIQASAPSTQPAGSLIQASAPSTQPAGSLIQASAPSKQATGPTSAALAPSTALLSNVKIGGVNIGDLLKLTPEALNDLVKNIAVAQMQAASSTPTVTAAATTISQTPHRGLSQTAVGQFPLLTVSSAATSRPALTQPQPLSITLHDGSTIKLSQSVPEKRKPGRPPLAPHMRGRGLITQVGLSTAATATAMPQRAQLTTLHTPAPVASLVPQDTPSTVPPVPTSLPSSTGNLDSLAMAASMVSRVDTNMEIDVGEPLLITALPLPAHLQDHRYVLYNPEIPLPRGFMEINKSVTASHIPRDRLSYAPGVPIQPVTLQKMLKLSQKGGKVLKESTERKITPKVPK